MFDNGAGDAVAGGFRVLPQAGQICALSVRLDNEQ